MASEDALSIPSTLHIHQLASSMARWSSTPEPGPSAPAHHEGVVLAIIGLFPVAAVAWAVLEQSKYMSALAQLGSLFSREQQCEEHATSTKHLKRATTIVKGADRAYFVLGAVSYTHLTLPTILRV